VKVSCSFLPASRLNAYIGAVVVYNFCKSHSKEFLLLMNQAETPKSSQAREEGETEQLSSPVVESLDEELTDSQLKAIAGGQLESVPGDIGEPGAPPRQETTIFRSSS